MATHATRGALGLVAPEEQIPQSFRLYGRINADQNGDIFGEYVLDGEVNGRASFRKTGATETIFFSAHCQKWVVQRGSTGDSCVAFADVVMGMQNLQQPTQAAAEIPHPVCDNIIWHIWDVNQNTHVPDARVVAVEAPDSITFAGRQAGLEKCDVVGEYRLGGIQHGKPLYRHTSRPYVIRYDGGSRQWLISLEGDVGFTAFAFAEAGSDVPHPGIIGLKWWFYCSQSRQWNPDPNTICTDAPRLLHVIGREDTLPNARITGTYHLGHSHDGRPMYHKPGTRTVLRYSAQNHWWTIDCDYMTEPSVASRLYQWIFNGNLAHAQEKCNAYAEATNSQHPGDCNLVWNVYDPRAKTHNVDHSVVCTTAPLKLLVGIPGAHAGGENDDIFGEYELCGTCGKRPYYGTLQSAKRSFVFYRSNTWVISRQPPTQNGGCVAFAYDTAMTTEHPAQVPAGSWQLYLEIRGRHFQSNLIAQVAPDAPTDMANELDHQASAELAANTAKRRRLDANNGRQPGAFARVFGGA